MLVILNLARLGFLDVYKRQASTVSTNLVTQAKVNAIIGPATSGGTGAAITNAAKASVPLITPSGTQDDLTKGQD